MSKLIFIGLIITAIIITIITIIIVTHHGGGGGGGGGSTCTQNRPVINGKCNIINQQFTVQDPKTKFYIGINNNQVRLISSPNVYMSWINQTNNYAFLLNDTSSNKMYSWWVYNGLNITTPAIVPNNPNIQYTISITDDGYISFTQCDKNGIKIPNSPVSYLTLDRDSNIIISTSQKYIWDINVINNAPAPYNTCPDQCLNHSTCDSKSKTCKCDPGWTGQACDKIKCGGTCVNNTQCEESCNICNSDKKCSIPVKCEGACVASSDCETDCNICFNKRCTNNPISTCGGKCTDTVTCPKDCSTCDPGTSTCVKSSSCGNSCDPDGCNDPSCPVCVESKCKPPLNLLCNKFKANVVATYGGIRVMSTELYVTSAVSKNSVCTITLADNNGDDHGVITVDNIANAATWMNPLPSPLKNLTNGPGKASNISKLPITFTFDPVKGSSTVVTIQNFIK